MGFYRLNRQGCRYSVDWNLPHHDGDHLFNTRIGSCRENSDLILYAMRSCGIPVAADFMPYSPDYRYSHEWNVVRDTTGKYIQFGFDDITPSRDSISNDGRKKGKVFRYCFSMQEEREKMRHVAGWNIGGAEGKYWKDVTSEYFGENETLVNLSNNDKSPIGLSVFSTDGWRLIGEGVPQSNNKILFKDIEPAVIYMPASLNNGINPAGYPFMLSTKGHVEQFIPDTANYENVHLVRKMALVPRVAAWGYSQIGARIEGDSNINFTTPKIIAEIKDTLDYTFQIYDSKYRMPIKYVRYVPPVGLTQIAELKLYSDFGLNNEIKLKPVSDIQNIENVIDNDILSLFYRESDDQFPLVFELESLTRVDRVYFISRTDDNYVWENDVYELLYCDGPHGWKSLGTKVADGRNITFDAPKNALLWLRNKTKGREEQVFIYKDNRQWFNSDF